MLFLFNIRTKINHISLICNDKCCCFTVRDIFMFARLYTTCKTYYPDSRNNHTINCTVNNVNTPLIVADDEIHSFGLFDSTNKLLGYFGEQGLTLDIKKAVYTNGWLEPKVLDAPTGCYIRSVAKYYDTPVGFRKTRLLH